MIPKRRVDISVLFDRPLYLIDVRGDRNGRSQQENNLVIPFVIKPEQLLSSPSPLFRSNAAEPTAAQAVTAAATSPAVASISLSCPRCTFGNQPGAMACEICNGPLPSSSLSNNNASPVFNTVVIASYNFDFEYLITCFSSSFQNPCTSFLFLCSSSQQQLLERALSGRFGGGIAAEIRGRFFFHEPLMQTKGVGSRHANYVMAFSRELVRVIITTSNLNRSHLEHMSNFVYVQDFPMRAAAAAGGAGGGAGGGATAAAAVAGGGAAAHSAAPGLDAMPPFQRDLVEYARRTMRGSDNQFNNSSPRNVQEVFNWPERLCEYDFSCGGPSAAPHFCVSSVPGKHTGEQLHQFGVNGLSRRLRESAAQPGWAERAQRHNQLVSQRGLSVQCTAAAVLDNDSEKYFAGLCRALSTPHDFVAVSGGGEVAGTRRQRQDDNQHDNNNNNNDSNNTPVTDLKFVHPTVAEVRDSSLGWSSGSSSGGDSCSTLSFTPDHFEVELVNQAMYRWCAIDVTNAVGWQREPPHCKTYVRTCRYANSDNNNNPPHGAALIGRSEAAELLVVTSANNSVSGWGEQRENNKKIGLHLATNSYELGVAWDALALPTPVALGPDATSRSLLDVSRRALPLAEVRQLCTTWGLEIIALAGDNNFSVSAHPTDPDVDVAVVRCALLPFPPGDRASRIVPEEGREAPWCQDATSAHTGIDCNGRTFAQHCALTEQNFQRYVQTVMAQLTQRQ